MQWIHHDPREAARADPPPESTRAVYLQIESWLPVKEEEQDNILVLTTRKESAHSLRSFCHQSRRNTNVETAVKVAGATAKHCIVLHGQSSFLSSHSNRSDFDKECYTRANVALSRATDLTVLACPLNMHGLEGATQVIAALLHGACTLHTGNTAPSVARVAGTFEIGEPDVQAETTAFLKATEPHPLWEGPTPLCLAEHYNGKVRRLRLVLTAQSRFSQGEQNQLLSQTHPLHGSALLFGYAADGLSNPDWLVAPDDSLLLPPTPGMHQHGCYWRPEAGTSRSTHLAGAQSPANDTPAGSPVSEGLVDHSTSALPSLLPSPDSINSEQNCPVRPVSVSSREEAESSPQASEPTALSVATVTSPTGGNETPVHEVSSLDSQMQVDAGAEDKEEEVATEDPVVEQEEEHDDESVWEVNDSSSLTPSGHHVTEGEAHSQSAEHPLSSQ